MAHEMSKALRRRLRDPMFAQRYFVGDALDIGAGADGLGRQIGIWPLLRTVSEWDIADGDAQELPGVPSNHFDVVVSSHCLEHVRDPYNAVLRWWEVIKPGGHLVVTIPDAEFYERFQWPSRFNDDHKTLFTMEKVADTFASCWNSLLKIERIAEHFDPAKPVTEDQTQGLAECAVEVIAYKRP